MHADGLAQSREVRRRVSHSRLRLVCGGPDKRRSLSASSALALSPPEFPTAGRRRRRAPNAVHILIGRKPIFCQTKGRVGRLHRHFRSDCFCASRSSAAAVIDDDLGRSAGGTVMRPGFEKLVAGLCAGEVGAVLCFDASRLARNGRAGIICSSCAASSRRPRYRRSETAETRPT